MDNKTKWQVVERMMTSLRFQVSLYVDMMIEDGEDISVLDIEELVSDFMNTSVTE